MLNADYQKLFFEINNNHPFPKETKVTISKQRQN